MAATSAFTAAPEPGHVSIDTIPGEILDKIFSFASDDGCDLELAMSSTSMATKLKHHPIMRLLLGLLTKDQLKTIFHEYFERHNASARRILSPSIGAVAGGELMAIRDNVVKANWCTVGFVGRVQVSLIKRILKTYWDPLLFRDRHQPSAFSHEYIWAELEDFESNPEALRDEWLIESRVDAVSGRYPWSPCIHLAKAGSSFDSRSASQWEQAVQYTSAGEFLPYGEGNNGSVVSRETSA